MKKTVKTVKKEYAIWIFVLLVFVFYLSWALAHRGSATIISEIKNLFMTG